MKKYQSEVEKNYTVVFCSMVHSYLHHNLW